MPTICTRAQTVSRVATRYRIVRRDCTMNCAHRERGNTGINKFDTHVLPSNSGNRNEIRIVIRDGTSDHAFRSNVISTLYDIERTFSEANDLRIG